MATLAPTWHSHRMVRDYVETFYLPGAHRRRRLVAKGASQARELSAGLDRLRRAWPAVRVALEHVTVAPGGAIEAEITAGLGPLEPADVTVQLWVAPTLGEPYPWPTELRTRQGGVARYIARPPLEAGPDAELVARVLPSHRALESPYIPGLITWSD